MSEWYKRGFGGLDESRRARVFRFGIRLDRSIVSAGRPQNVTKKILFLDDEPFCFYEHSVNLGASPATPDWQHYTCGADTYGQCPLCNPALKCSPWYKGVFTIVDLEAWKAKDTGELVRNVRMLFVASVEPLELLRLKKGTNGLRNCLYSVTRVDTGTGKSSVVGSVFDFVGTVTDLAPYADGRRNMPTPYNYEDIFRPLPVDTLIRVAARVGGPRLIEDPPETEAHPETTQDQPVRF